MQVQPAVGPVTVSIVVPAHNAAPTLARSLQALFQQDLREVYEVLVVDDGSTDATADIAGEYSQRVKVVHQAHRGAAAARNCGVRAATGEVVLFTDADCEPTPYWAAHLVRALRAGATGAKGTYRTRQRSITARFVQAEYEGKYRRMARLPSIDFIDTYSAGYRRDVLLEAGGFDESISAVEDQELSFRLAERGYALRFVPQAAVYHTHAASPRAYLRKKFWIGYYKVRVAALHPGRIVSDSHTPQSIKGQMALLAVSLACLPFAPRSTLARRALAWCGLGFLLTAAPFSAGAARCDMPVALAAPGMMLLRAAGLLGGVLAGTRRFGAQLARRAGYAALKRGLDLGVSSVGLVATTPLMAVIALAVKASSRGPALFSQWRAGRDGVPFKMYKFRTMVDGAEGLREGLVRLSGLPEPVLKLHPDPRVTRVGRFLRRWSLDELPQLANVWKGEMSLVGPRPEELRVVETYSAWHRERLRATPGITGPMQVNGRAGLSLDERVRLELEYIEEASILTDLRIIARTVRVVLSGDGAY